MTVLFGGSPFMETEVGYGWEEITGAVRDAAVAHDADFIATNRYQFSAQLAYALGDRDVTELSLRRTAFDDWFDPEAHRGQNAIVISDGREDGAYWKTRFAAVEKLGEVPVTRFGYPMRTYELFVGTSYVP